MIKNFKWSEFWYKTINSLRKVLPPPTVAHEHPSSPCTHLVNEGVHYNSDRSRTSTSPQTLADAGKLKKGTCFKCLAVTGAVTSEPTAVQPEPSTANRCPLRSSTDLGHSPPPEEPAVAGVGTQNCWRERKLVESSWLFGCYSGHPSSDFRQNATSRAFLPEPETSTDREQPLSATRIVGTQPHIVGDTPIARNFSACSQKTGAFSGHSTTVIVLQPSAATDLGSRWSPLPSETPWSET